MAEPIKFQTIEIMKSVKISDRAEFKNVSNMG